MSANTGAAAWHQSRPENHVEDFIMIPMDLCHWAKANSGTAGRFLREQEPGDFVSWHFAIAGCDIVSNCLIIEVGEGRVMALVPEWRLTGSESMGKPGPPITLRGRKKLALSDLRVGQNAALVAKYPNATSARLSGKVTAIDHPGWFFIGGLPLIVNPPGMTLKLAD